jgi:hypothetical protein
MRCGAYHFFEFVAQGFSKGLVPRPAARLAPSDAVFKLLADRYLHIETALVERKDQRTGPLPGLIDELLSQLREAKFGIRVPCKAECRRPRPSASCPCCMLPTRGANPFGPGLFRRDIAAVVMRRLFHGDGLSPVRKSCSSHILVLGVEASPFTALRSRSSLLKMAITTK